MNAPTYHIFTRSGDACAEVDAVVAQLGVAAPADAGLHKCMYVTRANQTVVLLTDPDTTLARALRARTGWLEPEQ
jgi:hypothetical protein